MSLELMVNDTLETERIISPYEAKKQIPLESPLLVRGYQQQLKDILDRKDDRYVVIAGPCSIHNCDSAMEYAKELKVISDKYSDKLMIIMRAYVEKPRTTVGWEGLLNDPNMDESYDISKGVIQSRELFSDINNLGLPIATEFLEPSAHVYLGDLVTWAAIGARSTEYQPLINRMSSLDFPVGFKNSTSGDLMTAVNAVIKSSGAHAYKDIDEHGNYIRAFAPGNKHSHVILRGGKIPNYDSESIKKVVDALRNADLPQNIIVDCSHGNSNKDYTKQGEVSRNVLEQRKTNPNIVGIMLESHLKEGKQSVQYPCYNVSQLDPGVSVTDGCVGLGETKRIIKEIYEGL